MPAHAAEVLVQLEDDMQQLRASSSARASHNFDAALVTQLLPALLPATGSGMTSKSGTGKSHLQRG